MAMLLAGCGGGVSTEVLQAQTDFVGAMDEAARLITQENWPEARAAVSQAKASLPVRESLASEDGNFAYAEFQADAVEAWIDLAAGGVDEAERQYQSIFFGLHEFENARATEFKNRVGSAQTWDAIFGGFLSASAAYETGLPNASIVQEGIGALTAGLAAEMPEDIRASVVDGRRVDADGIRITLMPGYGPMTNIGRLVSQTGFCTASLIGPRLALTNAHCVTEFESEERVPIAGHWPAKKTEMHILFEGLYLPDRVRVVAIHLREEGAWPVAFKGDYSQDWAILTLDRHPAGRGWFGLVEYDDIERQDISLAGHSGDLNDGRFLTVHWNCHGGTDSETAYLWHSCENAPGSSGTPILVTSGVHRLHYIIGLHAFGPVDAPGGGGPKTEQFISALSDLL